jgi:hypothetical protein
MKTSIFKNLKFKIALKSRGHVQIAIAGEKITNSKLLSI